MRKDRLRAVRLNNDLTQEELAVKIGTDIKQISRWESGKFSPNLETLVEIARALNVSADYLLGISDDPAPHERIDNLSDEERAVVSAMRRKDDKAVMKILANR
jgi:transcriptional regulator with XRE-family HTH domain